MKKYLFGSVVLFLAACNSKPSEESLNEINGYWEISKVETPEGNEKEYKINEWVDYYDLKDKKGIRKKLKVQIDGTYLANNIIDKITIVDSADVYYLVAQSKFTKFKDKIVSINEDEMVLENEAKIEYHYKRHQKID